MVSLLLYNFKNIKIKENFQLKNIKFFLDASFLRFLKMNTIDGDIILFSSYDEMANG